MIFLLAKIGVSGCFFSGCFLFLAKIGEDSCFFSSGDIFVVAMIQTVKIQAAFGLTNQKGEGEQHDLLKAFPNQEIQQKKRQFSPFPHKKYRLLSNLC